MKFINGESWYKVGEVSQRIGRSLSAINVWYEAEQHALQNGIHFPFYLPQPNTEIDNRGSRYWNETDIKKLEKFRDNLMRGDLAFYTRTLGNKSEKDLIREDAKAFKQEHELED